MPLSPNPIWNDTTTTTRENRSVEHQSLFTKAKPEPERKERPPTYKGIGKYPIMRSTRPKNW